MVILEYGRNVQKMIEHALTIEDREERNELARQIVRIMTQMQVGSGSYGDNAHKTWDHMFIISDFKLDVDGPYPMPDRETIKAKPEPIEYSDKRIRFKTYGRNLEKIVQKAIDFEEGEEKEALIKLIAHNLKKAYLNWNRNSVDDEQILEDLNRISDGKLKLPEGYELPSTHELIGRKKNYSKDNHRSSGRGGRDNKSNYKRNNRSDNQGRNDNRSKYGGSSNYKKRAY